MWFHLGMSTGSPVGLRKIFNFHLWKSGNPIQLSIWSVTCTSHVQEDMSHGIQKVIHKWNFFFELKDIDENNTFQLKSFF